MATHRRRSTGAYAAAVPLANGGSGDRAAGREQDGQRFEHGVEEEKLRKGGERVAFNLLFWYN